MWNGVRRTRNSVPGTRYSVLRTKELGRITGFDIMPPSDTHANAAVTTLLLFLHDHSPLGVEKYVVAVPIPA